MKGTTMGEGEEGNSSSPGRRPGGAGEDDAAGGRGRGRGAAPAPRDAEDEERSVPIGVGIGRGRGAPIRSSRPIGKKKLISRGKFVPLVQLDI
jgi:hypothetical protein